MLTDVPAAEEASVHGAKALRSAGMAMRLPIMVVAFLTDFDGSYK